MLPTKNGILHVHLAKLGRNHTPFDGSSNRRRRIAYDIACRSLNHVTKDSVHKLRNHRNHKLMVSSLLSLNRFWKIIVYCTYFHTMLCIHNKHNFITEVAVMGGRDFVDLEFRLSLEGWSILQRPPGYIHLYAVPVSTNQLRSCNVFENNKKWQTDII